jgi:outer membrane protein assembly factor BamB
MKSVNDRLNLLRTTPVVIAAMMVTTQIQAAGAIFLPDAGWPRFRGPTGDGVTFEKNLPTTWSATNGVLWKVDLPKAHNPYSSPIVWKDKVFVATAGDNADSQKLLCYAATDGKPLWETAVAAGPLKQLDMRGGFNCPTPCTDGERVYAAFGSSVLAAIDMHGREVWHQNIEGVNYDVSMASSPVLFGDLVIQSCAAPGPSCLMAFACRTGALKYKAPQPSGWSHSTPVLLNVDPGQPWLVTSSPKALYGLNPATGQEIWHLQQFGDIVSPVYGDGLIYCDSGRGGTGAAMAVEPKSKGDLAGNVKWKLDGLPGTMSSAVVCGGYLYRTTDGARLYCVEMATGKTAYTQTLPGASTWASPVATADGLVYFASGGTSYVVKAGPKFEVVATNDLGDPGQASPAVCKGHLFIRGGTKLWCIGR